MTKEFQAATETFNLTLSDLEKITINAMKSAFIGYPERCQIIYDVIKPGYAKVRQSAPAEKAR
jgi:adenosine deaminase